MKKTLIAVDSASAFTLTQANELGIAILPLSVIIEKETFEDVIGIDSHKVYEALRQNKSVSTSQVNIGYAEEVFKRWSKEYDLIFVFAISKSLSGTYNALRLASEQLELTDRIHVFDCNGLGGVQQSIVLKALEMVKKDATQEQIQDMVTSFSERTNTIIVPETLDQLKKGGRISSAAALMGSLLKIKAVLKLVNGGQTIDKYATVKTDKKVNEIILDEIADLKLPDEQLQVYLLHAENQKRVEEVEILIRTSYPNSNITIIDLPPVLVAHAGLGCIAMQVCQK